MLKCTDKDKVREIVVEIMEARTSPSIIWKDQDNIKSQGKDNIIQKYKEKTIIYIGRNSIVRNNILRINMRMTLIKMMVLLINKKEMSQTGKNKLEN